MKRLFLILVMSFMSVSLLRAQSLEETLSNLSSSAGAAYVKPVISAFGSNLNSGWFTRAPEATLFSFDLKVRLIGVGSFFTDDQKRLSTTGTFSFTADQIDALIQGSTQGLTPGSDPYNHLKNYMLENNNWQVSFSGPTIIGSESDHLIVTFPGQEVEGINFGEYQLAIDEVKGYLSELPALPSVAAQLDVGTVLGTTASFRWFPDMDIQDLGKFKFFGFGVMHNPEVWLNDPLPIDIAVGFFTQKLTVGTIFESSSTQYGFFASKTFGRGISFTPYLGLTMETSKTTVKYNYLFSGPGGIEETAQIGFELEGDNTQGLTVGATINLVFIDLNVDYKMAKTKTVSGSISFGF